MGLGCVLLLLRVLLSKKKLDNVWKNDVHLLSGTTLLYLRAAEPHDQPYAGYAGMYCDRQSLES